MARKAVETLHAHPCLERAPLPEQPEKAKRMTDRDAVFRPFITTFRPPRHKSEIEQCDPSITEMGDEVGPDAGMEAPAMNEDEMHGLERIDFLGTHARLICEYIEQAIDVSLFMRGCKGKSHPCGTLRHRGRPDGGRPEPRIAKSAA